MTEQWQVDILSCRGSAYDIGRQVAAGFRKTPRGRAFKRRKERRPFAFSLKNAEATLIRYAPNIWEELHGLADGLEISLERAVAEFSNGRLRYPPRGCSAVLSGGLYGRNYDYSIRNYDRLLVAVQPDGVHASIGFSDRFTGRDDGMNAQGLCVGLHYVNDRVWQPGLNCVVIVRMVLDQCASTPEALELLQRIPHGLCYNYSLMDASGQGAVVEASPDTVRVRKGDHLACANHFVSEDLAALNRRNPSSHKRYPHLQDWAAEGPAAAELFSRLNSSDSPVFAHNYAAGGGTLHSFVADPSRREMRLGVGGDAAPTLVDFAAWVAGNEDLPTALSGQLGGKSKPFSTKGRVVTRGISKPSRARAFTHADLGSAVFSDVNLAGARFDDINFAGAEITRNCNFKGMTLAGIPVEDLFDAYTKQQKMKKNAE